MNLLDIIRTPYEFLHPCEKVFARQAIAVKKRPNKEERRWLRKDATTVRRLNEKYSNLWNRSTPINQILGSYNV